MIGRMRIGTGLQKAHDYRALALRTVHSSGKWGVAVGIPQLGLRTRE
jgi:hypothetical protein